MSSLVGSGYFCLFSFHPEIYDVQRDITQKITENDAEAVYQTLEKMPFFWQDMNGAAEHMLTT
jgi:hypothetical protein